MHVHGTRGTALTHENSTAGARWEEHLYSGVKTKTADVATTSLPVTGDVWIDLVALQGFVSA